MSTLVIDWGAEGGLHVFCAVLAWSRVRFVRFAADERAETTLAMLAECFEVLGGVPGTGLADRMGCLKGGVAANVVVPAPAYLRFAAHHGFRPDFCQAHDPESKGIVENLVGYAKRDLMVPRAPFAGLAAANTVLPSAPPRAALTCDTPGGPDQRVQLADLWVCGPGERICALMPCDLPGGNPRDTGTWVRPATTPGLRS